MSILFCCEQVNFSLIFSLPRLCTSTSKPPAKNHQNVPGPTDRLPNSSPRFPLSGVSLLFYVHSFSSLAVWIIGGPVALLSFPFATINRICIGFSDHLASPSNKWITLVDRGYLTGSKSFLSLPCRSSPIGISDDFFFCGPCSLGLK